MNPVQISPVNALAPGADLWVIIDQDHPRILKEIDWYLNFQIKKNRIRPRTEISATLSEICQKTEITSSVPSLKGTDTLLVSAHKALPARWIAVLDPNHLTIPTDDRISQIWDQLGRPTLRVFSGPSLSYQKLAQDFQKNSFPNDVQIFSEGPSSNS